MGAASAPSCRFGGIRGRQRSAIRLLHGTALHGERRMRGPDLACNTSDICKCVHRAAASRRTASARFGSTIRDSSSRQLNGRRNPADARPILRGEAMHLHRCKMRAAATTWRRRARAFCALRVGGAHPAGCDPFARKRPEKLTKAQKYRLNIPALGLRRVVSSGYLSPPLPLAADDKTHQQQPLKCQEMVLRQFLWELKAGISYERVAKEKELTALNWLGTQRWGLALAAYAGLESTGQRWC